MSKENVSIDFQDIEIDQAVRGDCDGKGEGYSASHEADGRQAAPVMALDAAEESEHQGTKSAATAAKIGGKAVTRDKNQTQARRNPMKNFLTEAAAGRTHTRGRDELTTSPSQTRLQKAFTNLFAAASLLSGIGSKNTFHMIVG